MGAVFSNKYQELERLGQGGMGIVYKVRHTMLDTVYALKVLPAHLTENPEMVKRFYREARTMAQLTHANIVRVIDIDRDESSGLYYFVMEYLQGRVLKQYLKERGPLPLPEVLEVACQVARALVYAHRQTPPVIHRDIKPENIMVEEPSRRVVVLDFGIAKQLEAGSQFTRAGTPKYSAPEQFLGKPITGSADVYSLGLVLYEMITGKQFFAGFDNNAIFAQALDEAHELQVDANATIPAPLAFIINHAIAKSPQKRYPTMLDFIKELEALRRSLLAATVASEGTTLLLSPQHEDAQRPQMKEAELVGASAAELSRPAQNMQQSAPAAERKQQALDFALRQEPEPEWLSKPASPKAPKAEDVLFTPDGKLNRSRFSTEAFRALVATTGESHSVSDKQVTVFHLLMSLTRGSFVGQFYQALNRNRPQNLETSMKMLRARIRQAYRRPVREEKLIVRELYRADLTTAMRTLLEAATLLAGQRIIEERHLMAALLDDAPIELRPILQESGMTRANLQRYREEKGT
jgi:serine/threonine protein kinase